MRKQKWGRFVLLALWVDDPADRLAVTQQLINLVVLLRLALSVFFTS